MKKQVLPKLIVLFSLFSILSLSFSINAQATESPRYNGSALTYNTESIGTITRQTKGFYLQSGSSSISKIGTGKILIIGTTNGQRVVDNISISMNVDRWNPTDQVWEPCENWNESTTNAYALNSTRNFYVLRGYFYRARAVHTANSDLGFSFTDGIWIG